MLNIDDIIKMVDGGEWIYLLIYKKQYRKNKKCRQNKKKVETFSKKNITFSN